VARLLLASRARIGVPSAFSRAYTSACTSRARACAVVRSRRERKLNMPDSISQSTATVLRINGREMSYCAIFVRDLGARSLGHRRFYPLPSLSLVAGGAPRLSFVKCLFRLFPLLLFLPILPLPPPSNGGGYRRDASGERSRVPRVRPFPRPGPAVRVSCIFSLALFFSALFSRPLS